MGDRILKIIFHPDPLLVAGIVAASVLLGVNALAGQMGSEQPRPSMEPVEPCRAVPAPPPDSQPFTAV